MSKNDVFPSADSAGKSAAGALVEARPPATGGEDAFISYSRKDKVFVQKLHQALAETQRDIWVDWEDIPRTADWWSEIEAGIEAANTFIFIISPDSVASETCRREIAHAAKHHKRLVPIVHRDSPTEAVPKVLARLNYIFCRDSDDFDQAFQELLTALDTDLDWVKAHTRLLVRAREWEKHSRNDSFVLRGVDMEEAEQRLAQLYQNPEPTTLQREYVLASRKSATRRQQKTLGAVTLGLIVVIVLAIIAVLYGIKANRQARLALSRELAANALAQMPLDAELGRLLALEAARIETDETDEVERALRQTILNPLTTVLRGHTGGINSATFSPDGKWTITASIDESVRIWDTTTWKTVAVLPGNLGIANEIFSSDGRLVVIDGDGGRTAYDTSEWEEVSIPAGLEEKVAPPSLPLVPGEKVVASSPDGKYALTSGEDGKVQVWETGNVLSQLGGVTPTGEEMRQLGGTGEVTSAAFSPDGQLLITRKPFDNTAALWEVATGRRVSSLVGHTGWIGDVAFSPDSRLVATAAGYPDNSVRVWNVVPVQTQAGIQTIAVLGGHASEIYTVNFSPDSKLLITAGDDNTARIWEPRVGQNRIRYLELKDYTTVYSTAFSPDGPRVIVANGTVATVWDVQTGKVVTKLTEHSEPINSVAFNASGTLVVTVDADNTVRVWDASSGQLLKVLPEHGDEVTDAAFSPDGKRLVTVAQDKIARVWNVQAGEMLAELSGGAGTVTSAALSPDGNWVVTTGWDPGARVWEVYSRRIVAELREHTVSVNSAAFSPDGKFVVTASWDNTAKIWETATGRMVADLLGHIDQVYQATFSHDGRFVLTAGADYTARLWDAQTGQSLLVFRGHSSDVRTARFSPDSKLIATGSDDGTVQVFKCDVCGGIEELKYLAQQRVFRELTCEERQRFLHEQVTCPTPTPIAR